MSRMAVCIVLTFASFARADDWPQWRGPERTGISKETGLMQTWPEGGPALRWKAAEIGTGYSSPAVVQGRVYLQTTQNDEEFALALDEKTGAKVWRVPIGKVGRNRGPQYPGTRSTPTVDDNRLYCLASDGELVCLGIADGQTIWKKNFKNDFDGADGAWAYSESVLVDGDVLICTPGGTKAALVALNKNTGATVWTATVPDGGTAEYASIMPVDAVTPRQYVTFLRNGLVGIDALTGKHLWTYNKTVDSGANILTPVVAGDRVFSAGSRTGGGLVRLQADGTAEPIYFARTVAPSIGGAVLLDGYLYGTGGQTLFCADFSTGEVKWTDRAVGPASVCFADRRLYVRGHNSGDVVLVEPSAEAYREKGRLSQVDRSKTQAWPHPVIANGGLYLRDQGVLLCYDVAEK